MTGRAAGLGVLGACLIAGALRAQVPNDTCAGAIPLGAVVVVASNVGATAGPDPLPGCAAVTGDVWFSFVPGCNGTYTVSTCAAATSFGTVVTVWDGAGGCGALVELTCSDVCTGGSFLGASASASLVVGHPYFISVGGTLGGAGTFSLSASLGASMALSFFSTSLGTLGYVITEGPAAGQAFVAVTINAGLFPIGWFYGIDIYWSELLAEIATGFPFLTPLQPCGSTAVGPFFGLPSGLTVYGVALGIPLGAAFPTVSTLATIGVVP
jgi:hypothetical protein